MPYIRSGQKVTVRELPDTCPLRAAGDPPCRIGGKDVRRRKTGPGIPLRIVTCHTHKTDFTLYPPGYAPYQRKPVMQVSLEGELVIHDEEQPEDATAARVSPADFENTLFDAALDAQDGWPWARSDCEKDPPELWWSTQGRHLELTGGLLGIADGAGAREREAVAVTLRTEHQVLLEQHRRWKNGYRARGAAICAVLSAVRRTAQLATWLLHCGYLMGKWARPWVWDARRKCLETQPFRVVGTTAPT